MLTWHCYAIHSYVSLFQKIAQNALQLCGGDIFTPPAERVPTTVTEVHIAQLIHHQDVALGMEGMHNRCISHNTRQQMLWNLTPSLASKVSDFEF